MRWANGSSRLPILKSDTQVIALFRIRIMCNQGRCTSQLGLVSGKVFVGSIAIKDNPQFHSYLLAHKPVHEGFVNVLNKLETIVKAQFEKSALL